MREWVVAGVEDAAGAGVFVFAPVDEASAGGESVSSREGGSMNTSQSSAWLAALLRDVAIVVAVVVYVVDTL